MTIVTLVSLAVMLVALAVGATRLARWSAEDAEAAGDLDPDERPYDPSLLASMRRHPSALPAPTGPPIAGPPPPPAPLPQLHARARVVFAAVEDQRLVLDCVIAEADGPGIHAQPGLPITLSLGALDTPWLAVHVEAMLERWADGERLIDLEVLDSPVGPRATLVSASSRLVLPLATVAGLS